MSYLSKFVFDPIKAAIARAQTSSNPIAQATGNAAASAVATVAVDVDADNLSHNSAAGVANTLIGDLETGVKDVVDAFVSSAVGSTPVVGGMLAPIAVNATNVALSFAEQHMLTYISALFSHHKANIAASAQPAGTTAAGG